MISAIKKQRLFCKIATEHISVFMVIMSVGQKALLHIILMFGMVERSILRTNTLILSLHKMERCLILRDYRRLCLVVHIV